MRRIVALSLLFTLGTVAAVAADVLVTQSGEQIETRGPWKVKGRTVVFTSKAGVLSSIRLSEVDLEASELATAEANRPEPVAPPPKRKARLSGSRHIGDVVMTITNRDVGRAGGASVSGNTFGLDLSGLDESTRQRAMDELFALGKWVLRMHQQYDLHDADGVRQAAGAFESKARQLRSRAERSQGDERRIMEMIADGAEELARQAKSSPEAVMGAFQNLPPREEITDAKMDLLETPEGRAVFEEEIDDGGG